MFVKTLLIFQLIVLVCLKTTGQIVEHVNFEGGLSHVTVNSIIQDSKGFMWFGTDNGLYRYDGYETKSYFFDPKDTNSITNNIVKAVCEDRHGNIWVGTMNNGVNRINPLNDKITRFLHHPSAESSLSNNEILSIFKDSTGNIWIGTEYGLNKFNEKNNNFERFYPYPEITSPYSRNAILTVFEDSNKRLYIGTWSGGMHELQYNNGTVVFEHFKDSLIISQRVWTMCEDKMGNLLLGTYAGGCYKIDAERKSISTFGVETLEKSEATNTINAVLQDDEGRVWLGTLNGIKIIGNNRSGLNSALASNLQILEENRIRSLYMDKAGTIWIGTTNKGIYKIEGQRKQFENYFHGLSIFQDLSLNNIRGIGEVASDILWVGVESGKVISLNLTTGTYKIEKDIFSGFPNLQEINVFFLQENDHVVYIGTNRGLFVIDLKNKKKQLYSQTVNINSISNNHVWCVYKDNNYVWIGTQSGLNRLDKSGKIKIITTENNTTLTSNRITHILRDSDKNLWIGTKGGGLLKYIEEEDKFVSYFHDPNDAGSINSNYIKVIFEDSQGIMWLGTHGGGLQKLDKSSGKFVHYLEQSGLVNNIIYSILEDDHNNLWLSTNNGLSMFNYKEEVFTNYTSKDGLPGHAFFPLSSIKLPNGTLMFGGNNGLTAFHPDSIYKNKYAPPLVITDFKINNNSQIIHNNFSESMNKGEIKLSYRQNTFSVKVAALNFTYSNKNQYKYILEPFDSEWINAGTNRIISYTKVPPGEYVLKVMGSNNDLLWNTAPLEIKISIVPAFWQTIYFKLMIYLIVLLLIYSLFQYRIRLIKKKKAELERLVQERTHEISEQNLQIFKQKEELLSTYETIRARNFELEVQKNEILNQKEALEQAHTKLNYLADEIKKANIKLDIDNWELKKQVKKEAIARVLPEKLSFIEFLKLFPDESSCYRFLEEMKWKDGFKCKKCGNTKYMKGPKLFTRKCTKCLHIESITAYTIFHGIKFPVNKAFYLVYLVLQSPERNFSIQEVSDAISLRKSTCCAFLKKIDNKKQFIEKALRRSEDKSWKALFLKLDKAVQKRETHQL